MTLMIKITTAICFTVGLFVTVACQGLVDGVRNPKEAGCRVSCGAARSKAVKECNEAAAGGSKTASDASKTADTSAADEQPVPKNEACERAGEEAVEKCMVECRKRT